ncbi:KN motif and ankyrin repeat domain-containing protein 4 [Nibea albiflora]|uniref:KN motif and ankyrin repeat domain-containing protein 4 n=1 Tax=Nibea albiflora TaxID=240163 RepID=A0ACB7FIW1_NIBAL|nr:KN motif and ankyrin repeat domain-containing protein 4 [Nibea albiflora]
MGRSEVYDCADVNDIIQILNQAARFQPSGSSPLAVGLENLTWTPAAEQSNCCRQEWSGLPRLKMTGNILPHKTTENGVKGKPPYSVETPYGFRLDLDFLKYVDDIEKGNTIKRVPIQRRSKGPRASTLPRHLNPSGCGYRPSPWGSTGALGPRSRQSDIHHHGYTSWASDHKSSLSPTGLKSLTEMEARIKEFDEQPLGEHIRPHLLRASSLPLTVLLRQGSESTDDPGSLRCSRDHLVGRNISCEDVFHSTDSPRSQDSSGLLRRLTEALERVGELEMEIRVIPELRAQICILQEERERLRLGLNPNIPPLSMNGTTDPYTSSHYGTTDIKRPRHESHVMFPRNHEDSNPTHEWRTSTDLDELLTVTSLQAKVAVLEQKLHETGLELQRALGMLKEQQEESRNNDGKIEHLIRNPGVWVRAERVMVDQDGDEVVVRSMESYNKGSRSPARTVTANGQRSRQQDSLVDSTERTPQVSVGPGDPPDDGIDTAVVVHHIKKIKRLLDQQWECLCADHQSQEEGRPLKHPDPKVNSLQQEMMGLVDILTSYYTQHGHNDEERLENGGIVHYINFMAACQFLKDHMDNMDNPNDDMRKALVVVFQHWFSVAAEEASEASRLAVYLKEVKKTTPSLLAFLVNLADDNGNTVLHYSVSHCNYSIVSLLLDTGVSDANLQNNAGYTAVMLASLTAPDGPGGMEVVRRLMELGNIHIRSNQTGQTALHLAVRHGRVVMVRLLLSHGADANIQDSQGTTALMFAAERGHTHIARLLLERSQCDLTLTDKRGRTALSIAMQGSHTDTATLLQAHAKARAL